MCEGEGIWAVFGFVWRLLLCLGGGVCRARSAGV